MSVEMDMEEVLDVLKEKTLTIFRPRGKADIRRDYPELMKFEGIKKCSPTELKFVWFYKCKASEAYNLPTPEQKMQFALVMTFRNEKGGIPEQKKQAYMSGNFPDHMRKAMAEMEAFEPNARIQALEICNSNLKNYRAICSVDIMEDERFRVKENGVVTDEVDWDKADKYTRVADRIQGKLKEMVSLAESRFGVEEKQTQDELDDGEALANFHLDN